MEVGKLGSRIRWRMWRNKLPLSCLRKLDKTRHELNPKTRQFQLTGF